MVSSRSSRQMNSSASSELGILSRLVKKRLSEIEAGVRLTADQLVAQSLASGGRPFVERALRYGRTERDRPIVATRSFLEYLELIGDFRVAHTLTTGCAQIGKTLAHTLLLCDCLSNGLNTLWTYDKLNTLDRNVPSQFRPIVRYWLRGLGLDPGDEGTQNNSLYQIGAASGFFSYVSTSRPALRSDGTAAAGSAIVSLTADILFLEERSQYPPGSADPLPRRIDASLIPTRPIRELGTPGSGAGIERELKNVDFYFYPHYLCPDCSSTAPLDPKGCLLRPFERRDASGELAIGYLSEAGKPHSTTDSSGRMSAYWFHRDPESPVESAYIGCSVCGAELSDEVRREAHFRCLQTGTTLREFLDGLPEGIPPRRYKVGISLSPLTRQSQGLAVEIIAGGLEAVRSDDWQQQGLGHPSENVQTSVSLELIQRAIAAPPSASFDCVVAGIDQGRGSDWIWVVGVTLPPGWRKMPIAEVETKAVRTVLYGGDIVRSAIPDRLRALRVDFGLVDNEPDISSSSDLCRATVLEMADQRSGQTDAVKPSKVSDGGIEYPCWLIRNEKFLKQVLTNFSLTWEGNPLYRLPRAWQRWEGNPSEASPLIHLQGPRLDPDSGRWERGPGNVDDLYYAAMFSEAALHLYLSTKRSKAQTVYNPATPSRRSASQLRNIF